MLRSAIAVLVGFVYVGALSFGADALLHSLAPDAMGAGGRVGSTPVLLLVIAYVGLFAVTGCYLTARLAPNQPMRHALILGLLGLAFNLVGTVQLWSTAPAWYHVVSLLLVMPFAYVGGRLREMELARGGRRTPTIAPI